MERLGRRRRRGEAAAPTRDSGSSFFRVEAAVALWRKGDNDLGARLRLIASSSDELEKARS